MPHNRNVVVLAVAVSDAGNVPLTAAAPSLSPAPGTYTSAQSVTLSDSTPGAVIYYTTNGATPTTNSARYSAGTPLQVSSTSTIKAMAAASNYSNSAVIGATYTITSAPTAPQIATQPANQTVIVGQTATFSVVATGTAPLQYQWRENGTAITGATGSSYTTPATVSGDNGSSFTAGRHQCDGQYDEQRLDADGDCGANSTNDNHSTLERDYYSWEFGDFLCGDFGQWTQLSMEL